MFEDEIDDDFDDVYVVEGEAVSLNEGLAEFEEV